MPCEYVDNSIEYLAGFLCVVYDVCTMQNILQPLDETAKNGTVKTAEKKKRNRSLATPRQHRLARLYVEAVTSGDGSPVKGGELLARAGYSDVEDVKDRLSHKTVQDLIALYMPHDYYMQQVRENVDMAPPGQKTAQLRLLGETAGYLSTGSKPHQDNRTQIQINGLDTSELEKMAKQLAADILAKQLGA